MKSFFKVFLASLLALIVFTIVGFFILIGIAGKLASPGKVDTGSKAVLYLNLNDEIFEQTRQDPFTAISTQNEFDYPGLYDMVRIIRHAKKDSSIKGIYLKCNGNPNGFAASEELRNALLDFKSSKKFIYAYGDVITQKAYYVANVADKIYCNPKGGVEWQGFGLQYIFFKQALDRLQIDPQIFYAGKFKSATEPFREEKMTEPNKVQSLELLNYLYARLLANTAKARGIDTATLHNYANNYSIRTADDAARFKLIDATKYDDEVQDEIKRLIKIDKNAKINFAPIAKYAQAINFKEGSGSNKIALIYAQGDIVGGHGDQGQIGSDNFRALIRKARLDKNVKAIVFRVNSGGGSALASEIIWRELSIAKKEKPVILSFGDVAASGGYYLAANADSIFAQPNTITGSIGVFTIIPNMQGFFKEKLGVTFDGVKTAAHADAMTIVKPLTDVERRFVQSDVDTIYQTFLSRVAQGRKMSMAAVDSIGQGRVWTGEKALRLGLVDRLGNLQDAVDAAARMAKLDQYLLREYPEPQSLLELIFDSNKEVTKAKAIKEEVGEEGYKIYSSMKKLKQLIGISQARMPFEIQFK